MGERAAAIEAERQSTKETGMRHARDARKSGSIPSRLEIGLVMLISIGNRAKLLLVISTN